MKYSYQVLSTPTADTGSTIVLQYEGRKYLFGHVAEGTQRTFVEHGVAVTSLNQLFVTGKTTWANYGGLIGMILSIADARASSMVEGQRQRAKKAKEQPAPEIEKLNIHGGKNVSHLMATARRFIFRQNLPVIIKEYDPVTLAREPDASGRTDPFEKPTWSDENIKVWAMPLKPSYERRFESKSGFKSPRKRSLNEFEERPEQVATLEPADTDQLLREHIVKNMFNSDWRIDALHEEYLPNVQMPAAVFVRNPDTKDIERYKGPLPGGDDPVPEIKVLVRKPWPAASIERLPPTNPSSESMCYFVRSADQRGKFDPEKAKALNIPMGRSWSELTLGRNYTAEDGTIVTPDMVLGPTRPGKTVAVLDIPSELYIEDLLSRPEWQSPSVTESLHAIFWILGPGVGDDARIIEFASRIKNCDHIVSSTDYCPNHLSMVAATKSTLRLAKLNSEDFPVPVYDNVTLPQAGTRPEGVKTPASSTQKLPWKPAKPGLTLEMEPKYFFNEETVIPAFDDLHFINRVPKAVEQRLAAIRKRMTKPDVITKVIEMREGLPPLALESEIVTLGTGSSNPSKYRNVSATLLHVPGKGYYLFDCGENTIGQLRRVYGPEKFREVMQNLRLIWISHLHADHHLGTASVIKEWYKVNYGGGTSGSIEAVDDMKDVLNQNRLCVISDGMFIQWLEEYAGVEDFGFSKILPLSTTQFDSNKTTSTFVYRHVQGDGKSGKQNPKETQLQFEGNSHRSSLLRTMTGLENVKAVLVDHCKAAMAVTLEFDDDFKVSYSGDCRPSADFAEAGKDSTLLIHEATFQDDLGGQAFFKKHSTTAEAIEVGRFMNAKMLLLTHFSQRYAKISSIDSSHPPSSSTHYSAAAKAQVVGDPIKALDVPDTEWPDGDGGLDIPNNANIELGMTTDAKRKPRDSPMPVAMAFDYMKVRIRDIPISQMFSPAFEKLVSRLERASEEDSAVRALEQAALEAKKAHNKRKAKGKVEQKKEADVELPSRTASVAERKKSAWSDSESDSEWLQESDDDEPEAGLQKK